MVAGWLGSRCLAAQLLTAQSAGRWPSRHIPELHTIPRVPAAAAVRMEAADLLLEIDEAAWSVVPIRPADLSRVAAARTHPGPWKLRRTATRRSPHTLAPSALSTYVLSIGKLGQGQANYYLESVAQGIEDYYTGAGEAPGRWLGSATRDLGMGGDTLNSIARCR
jgi:hypothetical protein